MHPLYRESPLLLLSYTEGSHEFKLSQEGKDFLSSLESPLGIVGVAGLYRTGKSYLLNKVLLNRTKGFGVGPTVNPCTKGIWIWGSPIKGKTTDGKSCSVIILDTEGIGALDQDSDHDSRIFSLAVLIVSCFIYNSVGSIDEEALSNLSLVVNLTKHIHIKSKKNEEVGTEEYAQYFPSFIWVVRDFALRLVDNEGEVLSPKEYLEKALNAQKGFSDTAEEKNRIRRLLKEFFKDRDCCTLIRPISNEGDLQKLETIDQKELRPEFLEQIDMLRNKVLNNIKPKTLNSRLLNGEMLVALIESYVLAVNKGAVPNIENAWNYICKNECSKALEEAQDLYTQTISELISTDFPTFEDQIFKYHKQAKKKSLIFFRTKAIGEEADRVYIKLKEILNEKYEQLKFQNEVSAEKLCLEFLRMNYSNLNAKLKSGEYKTFLDFERDIRTLQQYFKEHGPKGPCRDVIRLDFCQNKLIDAADIFIKQLYSEIEIIESTTAEKIKVLESDAYVYKEELVKEKTELAKKITLAETEKKELAAKDSALVEQLEELKNQKEKIENELRAALKKTRDEMVSEAKNSNLRITEYEEKFKENERKLTVSVSEFNEKYALMDQKITFLENSLEQAKKKEKDLAGENKNQAKNHANLIKETQTKYENQIRVLERKLENETENRLNLEKELEEKEKFFADEKILLIENSKKLQSRLDENFLQIKNVNLIMEKKEKDFGLKLSEHEKNYEDIICKLNKKLEDSEKKWKKIEEALKTESNGLQKEKAILLQKVEFLETQLSECKSQLESERKQHSAMLLSLSSISDSSKNLETELEQLKEKHANELKYIDSQNESSKKKLLQEIEKLTQLKNEIELHYKLDSSEWISKQESINEDLNNITQERDKLRDQVFDLKRRLDSVNLENEAKLKKKVSELEHQIEEITQNYSEEIETSKINAEKSFALLKEFYEAEKKRLEGRITEEKEKSDRKYKEIVEEYEERLKQEAENNEEELTSKEQEIRELEAFMNEEISILKHQTSLDCQKILSLESYLKESKEQINFIQKASNMALEKSQERFENERLALIQKADRLISESSAKDRDLSIINFKKDQIESQFLSKQEEIKELKKNFETYKETTTNTIEELKKSNKALLEEISAKKSDLKRELALLQQEIEFKAVKITEVEKTAKDSEEKYRETLKLLKTEGGQELSAVVEKLGSDKEFLEKKLMEKKKTAKELTAGFNKQISQIEKDKTILNEKLMAAETKLAGIEFSLRLENERLLNIKEKKGYETDSQNPLIEENENLKALVEELQKELTDKNAYLDREKVLWENKYSFLSQQKDSIKNDLHEAQRQFEFSLSQLHKRELSGKEKQELATNSLISTIETRYKNQLKDLQDSLSSEIEQQNLKISLKDQEIKGLKEEIGILRRGKNFTAENIEKKIKNLTEIEAKLLSEIFNLQKEKNLKNEIQENSGFEKGFIKNKLADLDKRLKDAEQLRSQMFLELEKERAKWQIERDHLLTAKNEALEMVEKLEKRKEFLLRENEKLRNDRIKNRSVRRGDHQKAFSGNLSSSPTKFHEYSSQKITEYDSSRNGVSLEDRNRSFENWLIKINHKD